MGIVTVLLTGLEVNFVGAVIGFITVGFLVKTILSSDGLLDGRAMLRGDGGLGLPEEHIICEYCSHINDERPRRWIAQ